MKIGLDSALVLIGVVLLVLGLTSRLLKRLFLSSVLLALVAGVVLGPEILGVIELTDTTAARRSLEELARLTLAIALMGAGLHLTRKDLRENALRTASLLTVGMVGMWLLTGVGAWLILDLPVWAALLLAAILTPTDPVVASTLVTGPLAEKNIPPRVRRTLQLESGANDGLALPFVLLAAFMLTMPHGDAIGEWALEAGQQVGLGLGLGFIIGYAAGRLMKLSIRASEAETPSLLGVGLALALLTLGLVHLLGGSGILAVFIASLTFSALLDEEAREGVEETQEAITKFFVLPVFVVFGALLPWGEWASLGIPGLLLALWVLFLRRPPAVAVALAPSSASRRETAFLAWFGPLGAAAIYYATFAESFAVAEGKTIFAAATLAIACSVLVHSVTATPGARLLAGRSPFATLARPLDPESETSP